MAERDSYAFAAQALRELDFDRYAASLVLPANHRNSIQAIWAFSAEVAATSERVSDPTPGEIRLQWWVDALDGDGHGAVSQNPVAAALLDAISGNDLPSVPLLRLLAARRFDLYGDPMPDMAQFEGYAGETTSVLYQYAAMVLAGGAAEEAADAAGHLGVAQALVGHVRAFGYNASRGRIFLPLSVFTAHGVREADILSGTAGDRLDAALAQLCDMARDHLDKAEAAIAGLPKVLLPAFASSVFVSPLINAETGRKGEAVFRSPPDTLAFMKLLCLTGWRLRNWL